MYKYLKNISIFLVFSSVLLADDFSFSGYGSTGYIFYDRSIIKGNKEESFYAAKLQMEIELTKKIEAQLDFRAMSDEHAVELREFSVKFDYYDFLKFKFGNIKLPFGAEQVESRENLLTFDRSNGHDNYSELGYGGRSIGVMAYYKYSKKRPDFPYSYYFNLYKNNGLVTGAVIRGAYHYGDFVFGGSYLFQHLSSREPLNSNGVGADISFEDKNSTISVEGNLFKDPVVSAEKDQEIYGATFRLTAAYKFSTDGDVIKDIEPLYMFSTYYPDISELGYIEMQNLVGANFYFSRQVRIRLQGDLRLTKSQFSDEYTTLGSRGILELQVRF